MFKPSKPENKIVKKRIEVEGLTLSKIIEIAKKNNVAMFDCTLENHWTGYEDAELSLCYYGLKWTDEQFNHEIDLYEKDLKRYEDFIEEKNKKELLEKEEELRKLKEKQDEIQKEINKIKTKDL